MIPYHWLCSVTSMAGSVEEMKLCKFSNNCVKEEGNVTSRLTVSLSRIWGGATTTKRSIGWKKATANAMAWRWESFEQIRSSTRCGAIRVLKNLQTKLCHAIRTDPRP